MISVEALRRHVIAAQGYTGRRRTSGVADVEDTIRRLGAVQLDSISTVDRSHRLTLASRIGSYPAEAVNELLARRAGVRVLGARSVPDDNRPLADVEAADGGVPGAPLVG